MAQDIINALSLGSIYALLSLGLALIFGVMRLVNMAHGELLMVGGYTLYELRGLPWPIAVVVTLVVVVIAGLLLERSVFRPLRSAGPTTLLAASFAVSYLLQNVALLVYGAMPRTVSIAPSLGSSISIGSVTVAQLSVVTLASAALLVAGLTLFLKRSPLGVRMRAAAENMVMARLLGVRASSVVALAFAISGMLGGVSAVLLVAQTGTLTPTMGAAPILAAFVATVIGGLASLPGAALGGMLLGVLTVAFDTMLPDGARPFRDSLLYGLLILVLLVRPNGLLASSSVRRAG